MKDDSLSDVQYPTGTIYNIYQKDKKTMSYLDELKQATAGSHAPDSVGKQDGGYCVRCDTVWAEPGRCKCDPLLAKHDNVYAKQIWNDAIEAAAKLAQWSDVADEIRKLKK